MSTKSIGNVILFFSVWKKHIRASLGKYCFFGLLLCCFSLLGLLIPSSEALPPNSKELYSAINAFGALALFFWFVTQSYGFFFRPPEIELGAVILIQFFDTIFGAFVRFVMLYGLLIFVRAYGAALSELINPSTIAGAFVVYAVVFRPQDADEKNPIKSSI